MIQPPAYFGTLERHYGIPLGFLDQRWLFESSRGQDMLNPESGARGHFGMMPDVYRRAGIDPMDLSASAAWTAREAARAQQNFPRLDPLTAGAAQHFGGPNTDIWGPQTTAYVNRSRKAYGMDPLSNYELVSMAGGDPSRRSRTIPDAAGAQQNIYSAGLALRRAAPQREMLLPAPTQEPLLGAPEQPRNLLTDPRFWASFSAAIDPYMLPTQALGVGLAAGYADADARKLAFENAFGRRETRLAQLQQRRETLEQQRANAELARRRHELAVKKFERGPPLPADIRSLNELGRMYPEKSPEELLRLKYPRTETGVEVVDVNGVPFLRSRDSEGNVRMTLLPSQDQAAIEDILQGQAEAEAEGAKWGEMLPTYIAETSRALSDYRKNLRETEKFLEELNAGMYTGKIGPGRGRITPHFDAAAALLRSRNLRAAIGSIQEAGLSPISDADIAMLQEITANPYMTEAQAGLIMRDVARVQRANVAALEDQLRRLRSGERLKSTLLNPDGTPAQEPAPAPVPAAQPPSPPSGRGWNELLGGF